MQKKIKSLLALHGLTQRDLSSLLGLNYTSVNLKLNNRREFTSSELIKMSDFFNVTIDELVR